MTELDEELGPIALELIEEFGKSVRVTIEIEGDYDDDTLTYTKTPVPFDIKALVEDWAGQDKRFTSSLAQGGDKIVTIAALGMTKPNRTDKVTFDNVEYNIEDVDTVYSGELACLYILLVRV